MNEVIINNGQYGLLLPAPAGGRAGRGRGHGEAQRPQHVVRHLRGRGHVLHLAHVPRREDLKVGVGIEDLVHGSVAGPFVKSMSPPTALGRRGAGRWPAASLDGEGRDRIRGRRIPTVQRVADPGEI